MLNDAKATWRDPFVGDAPEEILFIARMGYTHWGMCVIELSKLFTNSPYQQFNLFSLLIKFESLKDGDVSNEAKYIDTEKYRTLLKEVGEDEILKNLKYVRNKVFAYTDKVFINGSLEMDLDFTKLKRLQKIAFELISEIYLKVYDQTLEEYMPNTAAESTFKLLNKELKGV